MVNLSESSALSVSVVEPKFPYPSKLNVGNFVSLKLTNQNFLLWEMQLLSLIECHDLEGFVNGEVAMPEKELEAKDKTKSVNPDYTSWIKTDRLVKAWIIGTLSEEALGLAVGHKTARDVWKALHDAFAMNTQARKFELDNKLRKMEKNDMSVDEYLRGFKQICDELSAIGNPLDNDTKVFHLLTGLGPDYQSFRTTYLRPPIPEYTSLVSSLKSEEVSIGGAKKGTSSDMSLALYTQGKNQNGGRQQASGNRGRGANTATRGRGGGGGRGGRGGG